MKYLALAVFIFGQFVASAQTNQPATNSLPEKKVVTREMVLNVVSNYVREIDAIKPQKEAVKKRAENALIVVELQRKAQKISAYQSEKAKKEIQQNKAQSIFALEKKESQLVLDLMQIRKTYASLLKEPSKSP